MRGWSAIRGRCRSSLSGFGGVVGGGDLVGGHRQARHGGRRARVEGLAQQQRQGVPRVVREGPVQGDVAQRSVAGLPGTKGELSLAAGDGAHKFMAASLAFSVLTADNGSVEVRRGPWVLAAIVTQLVTQPATSSTLASAWANRPGHRGSWAADDLAPVASGSDWRSSRRGLEPGRSMRAGLTMRDAGNVSEPGSEPRQGG